MQGYALSHDPMAYRFADYPRPGSIYRLPDIVSLVRGPTLVRMPSGQDIRVDARLKMESPNPANVHDEAKGQSSLEDLLKILKGDKRQGPPPGFKTGSVFDSNVQNPLLHPREQPRRAAMDGDFIHF
jgi:hypothetical protein